MSKIIERAHRVFCSVYISTNSLSVCKSMMTQIQIPNRKQRDQKPILFTKMEDGNCRSAPPTSIVAPPLRLMMWLVVAESKEWLERCGCGSIAFLIRKVPCLELRWTRRSLMETGTLSPLWDRDGLFHYFCLPLPLRRVNMDHPSFQEDGTKLPHFCFLVVDLLVWDETCESYIGIERYSRI